MKNLLLSSLYFFYVISLPAQNDSSQPIIFITDASGSMWQKVGSEYKISLAREVLGDLTSGMPDGQAIGLVAYGHRDKGDCADIEELLPASNQDKEAFRQALDDLNPLGKTPLAQSAKTVIEKLKNTGASATIILITDGMETCEGNLCEVVQDAKAAGIDFVLHIVGFDLGDADRAPLECAARAGDGLYIDASDKDQLSAALRQTSELTVDIPKGRLSVEVRRNGELIDGGIIVYKTGTDEDIASLRSYTGPRTNPAVFNIPAGAYDVEVSVIGKRGVAPMKKTNLIVTEEDVNEQLFDFTSGRISLTVTANGELHDATVNVRQKGNNKAATAGRTYASSDHNPFNKELSPGIYDVEIGSVTIKGSTSRLIMEDVEIKAGETTSLEHDFQSATLSVGATFNGALCDATVNIVSVNPKKSVDGGRTYTSAESNPKSFLLSPGTYEVEVRGVRVDGDPREKFTVTLDAGTQTEKIIEW